MGSNQSSQMKQTTEILNKSVTNVVNTNVTKASASNSNVNNFEILVGPRGDVKNCPLNLNQKIDASQQLKVMAKVQSLSDLKTMLQSAVDNTTKQSNDATSGFLSTAFNNQKSNTEITNILHNEIENNVTSENLTECNGLIDNINKGKLEFNGKWDCGNQGPITINQDLVSAQVVECFSDALQQALMKNENISAAVNKSEQANVSKVGGVAEAISAVMGPYAMIIIAVVMGVVIFIPIVIFALKSGGSSEEQPQYSQPQYAQPQYAQPQYAQPQYAQPQYAQYPPSGRLRGSSYSPLMKYNIDNRLLFVVIVLVIIYFSKRKEIQMPLY